MWHGVLWAGSRGGVEGFPRVPKSQRWPGWHHTMKHPIQALRANAGADRRIPYGSTGAKASPFGAVISCIASVTRDPRPGPRFLQGQKCTSCSPPCNHTYQLKGMGQADRNLEGARNGSRGRQRMREAEKGAWMCDGTVSRRMPHLVPDGQEQGQHWMAVACHRSAARKHDEE
mgnify:CR=1 FL=1